MNLHKIKILVCFLFLNWSYSVLAQSPPIIYVAADGTGDYNCDGTKDQIEINQALDFVANNPEYTTVFLKGESTYWIDEPIFISENTTLEGEATSVVKLVNFANWNQQYKPLIGQKGTQYIVRLTDQSVTTGNIKIRGFELDGNRVNQNEPSGHSYYRMIQLQNCYNVTINDMFIHNGLADGILVEFSENGEPFDINSKFYNNRIHNDGHDGIYVGQANNFSIYNNNITNSRTDASIRTQNCNHIKIFNNIAGNAPDRRISGVSAVHIIAYGDNPVDDVEIYNNFFYGNQNWYGIWLEQENKGGSGTLDTHKDVYIHHNVISQYRSGGIGIFGFNDTRIENNLIEISTEGPGIVFVKGDPLNSSLSGFKTFVKNNIIVKNATYGIENKKTSVHSFIADYNCINGNTIADYRNVSSQTDIYSDPLLPCSYEFHDRYYNATTYYIFSPLWMNVANQEDTDPSWRTDLGADAAFNVYHPKSKKGRWDGTQWIKDDENSPCIDAGDPIFSFDFESNPNGDRINIGAFGNTVEASKSLGGSVDILFLVDKVGFYPHVVGDSLKIIGKNSIHGVMIVSLLGNLILESDILPGNNDILLGDVPNGIYMIGLNGNDGWEWYKIVVTK